ncbi:MAG TPA: ATP-grasp fold amidoligase family protein [Pseudonocardia sp.]|nr:ATP-grasp fold amidoligase family protein [Pseudonocardia sp.]
MSSRAKVILARRFRFLPPRLFAMVVHLFFQGEFSTLRRPTGFVELLAAKNLSEPDPLIPLTADKFAVRDYVARKAGEQYLVPLRQVVDRAEDLDPGALTPPCVVKATHGCDMTLLLRRGDTVDRAAVTATVRRWLATDYYRSGWREIPYRGLPRRVVVEDFLGDGTAPPPDYKLYMFRGRLGMVQIDHGRFGDRTSNLVDPEWREINVVQNLRAAPVTPACPAGFPEMVSVAEKLSADFEFARIDLYDVDGRVYFGEITHFPGGGLMVFHPRELDRALGRLWRHGTPLPESLLKYPRRPDPAG